MKNAKSPMRPLSTLRDVELPAWTITCWWFLSIIRILRGILAIPASILGIVFFATRHKRDALIILAVGVPEPSFATIKSLNGFKSKYSVWLLLSLVMMMGFCLVKLQSSMRYSLVLLARSWR